MSYAREYAVFRSVKVKRVGWLLCGVLCWLSCKRASTNLPVHRASSIERTTREGVRPIPAGGRVSYRSHPPFARVAEWTPPSASDTRWLLLHGNQGTPPDPTWMIDFRFHAPFRQQRLLVPSLANGDYEWDRARNTQALQTLITRVSPSRATYVLGYSAGASRVFAVANALSVPIAGIVAIAGDVLRPLRGQTPDWLANFRSTPVLLLCMTEDDGENTRCALNERNQRWLVQHGVRNVLLRRLPGTHSLDSTAVAEEIEAWSRAAKTIPE